MTNVLTQIADLLTLATWAVLAVAVAGLALGAFARTLGSRHPYHAHSAPIRAAIRWEGNWHR